MESRRPSSNKTEQLCCIPGASGLPLKTEPVYDGLVDHPPEAGWVAKTPLPSSFFIKNAR